MIPTWRRLGFTVAAEQLEKRWRNVAGIEHLRKKELGYVISVKEAWKRKDRRDSKEEIEQDGAGFVAMTPAYLKTKRQES